MDNIQDNMEIAHAIPSAPTVPFAQQIPSDDGFRRNPSTMNEDTDIMKSLFEAGSEPNQAMENGATPLIAASYLGKRNMALLLIDYGADINAANHGGGTAMMAAAGGHADVVELLLNVGADASRMNRAGQTALTLAEKQGHSGVVSLLRTNI